MRAQNSITNTEKFKNKDENHPTKNTYELQNSAYSLTGVKLDPKHLTLLRESKILTIYGVLKGEDDKNSIVWGLATNKERTEFTTS